MKTSIKVLTVLYILSIMYLFLVTGSTIYSFATGAEDYVVVLLWGLAPLYVFLPIFFIVLIIFEKDRKSKWFISYWSSYAFLALFTLILNIAFILITI